MLMSAFPWVLYVLAWVCTLGAVNTTHAPFLMVLLWFVVVFNGGIQGIWAAVGHLGFPKKTAKQIGWTSNQFQAEIGFANLAIGLVSLACLFYKFWVIPVALILALFWIGVAYTHYKDYVKHKNKAPLNYGPYLANLIVVVITIMWCIIVPILQSYKH